MEADLVVLGQDPAFGGGGSAQTNAFLAAAEELGRQPAAFLFDPHPALAGRRLTWRRVELLRQLRAARALEPDARSARSLWVVATLAQHGAAAPRSGRPYGCWIGTTIASEWEGRSPGLSPLRRRAAVASLRGLIALERQVLKGAGRLYATSASSREQVAAAAGVDREAVGILPIPVDVEHLRPADDETWHEAATRPVLTFLGRGDDPRKNVPLLLEAFRRIRSEFPDAQLRLVGRPPREAVPAGVEAVGEVDDPAGELRRAALFLLPSRQEGFGIVVAEAMASGLPVVTTPSGGPEELVRRSRAGVVTAESSARAFADSVVSLLRQPDELVAMRRRGREYVEREHSPAAFRDALRVALEEVDSL